MRAELFFENSRAPYSVRVRESRTAGGVPLCCWLCLQSGDDETVVHLLGFNSFELKSLASELEEAAHALRERAAKLGCEQEEVQS